MADDLTPETTDETPPPPAEAEATPETAPEGEAPDTTPPAEGDPAAPPADPKDDDLAKQPASLRAAVRLERKAKAKAAEAETKLQEAAKREQTWQQEREQLHTRVRAWEADVTPKLQRLGRIDAAAKEGRVVDLLAAAGIDRDAAIAALSEDLANPVPPHLRKELDEVRKFREEQAAKNAEAEKQRLAAERQQQAVAQDEREMGRAIAYGAFPNVAKYRDAEGMPELMASAYEVQRQLTAAGKPCDWPDLLRELDARAATHFARAGASSANPPPTGGQGQPGNAAPPAAAGGARRAPSAVTGRAASESGGGDEEFNPEKARAKTLEILRQGL